MAPPVFLLACAIVLLASSFASADIVEHSFHVQNLTVKRLCHTQVINAVNGSLPGPKIRVREGDTLVVHVFNKSPYNLTIHWHGIFQLLSGWADGPVYVTQCPILPGNSYTYRFNITRQEGEWWDANVIDVENQALVSGGAPNISNAFTINGQPGDLYPCSSNAYYMAAHPYASAAGVLFDNTTTTGIIVYDGATSLTPKMPVLPAFNDTPTAHKFYSNLTELVHGPYWTPVPLNVDEHMFITVGLGLAACGGNATCAGPLGQAISCEHEQQVIRVPHQVVNVASFFQRCQWDLHP
ncbi:hypothetical protein F0562_016250 [Nyssa sinensis]|uniref:Plastocyanin-like domain-containing protein n=1 Tax=Nyssa sinensis TaxID=561372 RepID=A0A5J4ZMQ3_9ASTE|nr:hypothetical protein F0562_016250 [Nyssa sinensis]